MYDIFSFKILGFEDITDEEDEFSSCIETRHLYGQCARTISNNHSSLISWKQRRLDVIKVEEKLHDESKRKVNETEKMENKENCQKRVQLNEQGEIKSKTHFDLLSKMLSCEMNHLDHSCQVSSSQCLSKIQEESFLTKGFEIQNELPKSCQDYLDSLYSTVQSHQYFTNCMNGKSPTHYGNLEFQTKYPVMKSMESESSPENSLLRVKSLNGGESCNITLKDLHETEGKCPKPLLDSTYSSQCYHPKKKIFRHWSMCDTFIKEAETEYKHKKIRRQSKESHIETSNEANELENYKVNDKQHRLEEYLPTKENKNKLCPVKRISLKMTKKGNKKKRTDKWETAKERKPSPDISQLRSCLLTAADLLDGLRVLVRFGSQFLPGRLSEVSPPDIYGVIIDKQRGNKPYIFSREEILEDAVRFYIY